MFYSDIWSAVNHGYKWSDEYANGQHICAEIFAWWLSACCLSPWRPILSRRLSKQGWSFRFHFTRLPTGTNGSVSKPCTPLVNIKIAGKWMFIPLKMELIGIDPYPNTMVGLLKIIVAHVVMLPRHAKISCKNPWDCVYQKTPQAVPSLKRQGLASNLPLSLAEGMNCGRLGCRQWVH